MNSTPSQKKSNLWANRRHCTQAIVLILYFLLPIPLPFNGFEKGIIRLDFDEKIFHFFGLSLVSGTYHLLLISLFLGAFFVMVLSALYSKVFCGWLCPQNSFYELFAGIQSTLKKRFPSYRKSKITQKILEFSLALTVALLIAHTACSYFIAPHPIFSWSLYSFLLIFVTLDTFHLKHTFCEFVCPYAYLQRGFQDKDSLHVQWDEERSDKPCGTCRACEVACYVDLDVKKEAFHIDCTMCGACIDACNGVYARKEEVPLLKFAFQKEESPSFLKKLGFNSSFKISLTILFLISIFFFGWTIINRPLVLFRIDYPLGGTALQLPIETKNMISNQFFINIQPLEMKSKNYALEIITKDFSIVWPNKKSPLQALQPLKRVNYPFIIQYNGDPKNLESLTLVEVVLKEATTKRVMGKKQLYFKIK